MSYGEIALIGWILTFLCIGFFILGFNTGIREPVEETDFSGAAWFMFALMGAGLTIWFIVF